MAKIEFVLYDGAYPVLCSGKLIVRIDGKEVSFGQTKHYPGLNTPDQLADYPSFWHSGGSCGFDGDYSEEIVISDIPWELSWDDDTVDYYRKEYPPEIWEIIPEILKVMNEHVPGGCCGGCL